MPEPPYRALCIFLRVFSLLTAVGGLLMIFAEKPLIVRIFLRPPEGEVSTLLLSLLKEMGVEPGSHWFVWPSQASSIGQEIPCGMWTD
jgi:hypothetical protein